MFGIIATRSDFMNSITLHYSKDELLSLLSKLEILEASKLNPPAYAIYCYQLDGCRITAYQSGKLLIQGNDVEKILPYFQLEPTNSTPINQIYPQAGSDEVGTGDYFGPVIVCACIVKQEDVNYLKSLGVDDSKTIQDDKILKIGPLLIQRLLHSILIVDNQKYNQIHSQNNMVAMKAKLHNQAYVHLKKKANGLPAFCIVDQFAAPHTYYKYLNGQNEIIQNLHFETKAEHKYLAVAASSIIARYAFLIKMQEMSDLYGIQFIKGASHKVDECGVQFVKKYGADRLHEVAKYHFANTNKILSK